MKRRRRKSADPAPSEEFRFLLSQVWGEPRELRSTPEEMAARRDARVREIVAFAFERVAWYARAMRERGLEAGDVTTAADLARLPVIDPEALHQPRDFVPRGADLDDFVALTTSGSTGEPRTVYHDLKGMLAGAMVNLRARAVRDRHFGPAGPERTVRLALPGNPDRVRRRLREAFPALGALFQEGTRIEAFEDPALVVEELRELRPDHLGGYASAIGRLFRHVKETAVDLPLPRVVTHSFDALSASERRMIEEEFGIPTLGSYGSTEAFSIAFECGAGEGYHVNEDVSHVRIADPEGESVPSGEPGTVIVSNLVNRGTVLLNYTVGDLAAWIPEPCPCGRPLPRLRLLEGRDNAWIERPGGTRLHSFRLANALTRPDVGRWQIAQPDGRRLVVRVLPQGAVDRPRLAFELESVVRAETGPELEVVIEFPDVLEATRSGKVLSFVRR
ncbi:MAG TPA: AMP-binding protein [Gemmatimonadota bacterium]|nr:AMP-binding protein [Gemmatimonadota bacterium]